jgi:hypothetical protein
VAKNDAWLHLRATAINLRRLLNLGLTAPKARGFCAKLTAGNQIWTPRLRG